MCSNFFIAQFIHRIYTSLGTIMHAGCQYKIANFFGGIAQLWVNNLGK